MIKYRKKWKFSEEKILIDNYNSKTIKELIDLLPGRDQNNINMKIKRLKNQNKLVGGKSTVAIDRAYRQRQRPYFLNNSVCKDYKFRIQRIISFAGLKAVTLDVMLIALQH